MAGRRQQQGHAERRYRAEEHRLGVAALLGPADQREHRHDGDDQHRQVDMPVFRHRQAQGPLDGIGRRLEQAGHQQVQQEYAAVQPQ